MEKDKKIISADVHSMIEQLRKGQKVKCHKCSKGYYVTNVENVAFSYDFYCDNCGNVIRISPNIIVE